MKKAIMSLLIIIFIIGFLGCRSFNIDLKQDGQPSAQQNKISFEAVVVEAYDNYFLVSPAEGSLELNSSDKIEVPIGDVEFSIKPQVGDIIKITYNGEIQETYPARISTVYEIEISCKKSTGVPMLKDVANYTQEQLDEKLAGLSEDDMHEIWGNPDGMLSGLRGDVWHVDAEKETQIVVYYNNSNNAWVVDRVKFNHNKEAVSSTTFVYEKKGCGGDFTITINDDGTFQYYEGMLSSYVGYGTWILDEDGIICITDNAMGDRTRDNYFKRDGNDLIWIEQGSDNFMYVKVVDGEKFSSIE